ncbi:unnamed protein product [Amoebophrya sp. A120]|nr:unnamed protein product [Amoebophrya sp. A120]|eukprot:GSA120T00000346001.1
MSMSSTSTTSTSQHAPSSGSSKKKNCAPGGTVERLLPPASDEEELSSDMNRGPCAAEDDEKDDLQDEDDVHGTINSFLNLKLSVEDEEDAGGQEDVEDGMSMMTRQADVEPQTCSTRTRPTTRSAVTATTTTAPACENYGAAALLSENLRSTDLVHHQGPQGRAGQKELNAEEEKELIREFEDNANFFSTEGLEQEQRPAETLSMEICGEDNEDVNMRQNLLKNLSGSSTSTSSSSAASAGDIKAPVETRRTTSATTTPLLLSSEKDPRQLPTVILNVGMAGSGKTTLMHRMYLELIAKKKRVYMINLDPAVQNLKYPRHIDIRDTVDYKKVMEDYGHGPNGAIMTSLGLFAMKFHQVLQILDKRSKDYDYVLVDTPGQIEVFGWSASGQIIADTLATPSRDNPLSGYPTVINYVVDTARCTRPVSFMSNMLYACSILYKFQLPFVLTFNKCDVLGCGYVKNWLTDQQAFSKALRKDENSYLESLSRSMSHVLEEFYMNMASCSVSAHTGENLWEELLSVKFPEARKEYYDVYLEYLRDRAKWVQQKREQDAEQKMKEFEDRMTKTKA